jgi:GTP:adenosylcobinamide-phosphate guanylyltransferase
MDDFNVSALHESKNEWGSRLVTILTPLIIDGYKSILDESIKLCKENGEMDKYLMTFQNLISRIPKWNTQIIETERKRICEKSGCTYLEDLVTCVHIIQLKILTAMRVGQKQKKIDINIPKLDDFIHKTYINVARKLYKNVYLFETNIAPLSVQKHYRELEIIVQECILNTLRESIPVESILKAYMDETVEEDVIEEIKEQIIEEPIRKPIDNQGATPGATPNVVADGLPLKSSGLSFNDIDYVKTDDGSVSNVNAPKSIERLEEISQLRNQQRKMDEEEEQDNGAKLKISDQVFNLDSLDVHNIEEPRLELLPDLLIDDIEILE